MSNSNAGPDESCILDRVLELLDESYLKDHLDTPIDNAAGTFTGYEELTPPFCERQFLEIVTNFVAHMYLHALPVSQVLSPAQARAEAIELLEQACGYDSALLDVIERGDEGLAMALSQMTATLKAAERRKHLCWVMASQIEPLPWRAKRDIVKELLQRWQTILPDKIVACPPEQLTHHYASLIRDYVDIDQQLKQLAGNSFPFK